VYCDAGWFIALAERSDRHHQRAVKLLKDLSAARTGLVTSWPVVAEAATALRYRFGVRQARVCLRFAEAAEVVTPERQDYLAATDLFLRRGQSRVLSLVDALTSVLVRERLGSCPCLSFDDDLAALGLVVIR
jgi:predicted nucleic acid-binding protein